MVENGPFSHKIDYVTIFLEDSKSRRAFKSQYWFESYGNFAELVDLAYWWSFSGEGSASAACAAGLFIISVAFLCLKTLFLDFYQEKNFLLSQIFRCLIVQNFLEKNGRKKFYCVQWADSKNH